MLTVQTFGKYIDEYNEIQGQNALYYYVFPSGDCRRPVPAGHFFASAGTTDAPVNALRPHEFYQWIDPNPAHDVPADTVNNIPAHPRVVDFVTTPLGGVDGFAVNVASPMRPALLGAWAGEQPQPSTTEANLVGGVPVGAGRYSHSISLSADGSKAYMSQWDGGFLTLDSSAFANATTVTAGPVPVGPVTLNKQSAAAPSTLTPLGAQSVPVLPLDAPGNAHSAVELRGTNDVVGGDEIYVSTDGCPFGWMHVFDQGDETTAPHQISEFKLPENSANCDGVRSRDTNDLGKEIDGSFTMHNQTVTPWSAGGNAYVITSWYGGGLRVINVTDPSSPTEAGGGFFVPTPSSSTISTPDTTAPIYGATKDTTDDDWWVSTWSYPIVRDGLIYVSDVRSGLYILGAKTGSALQATLSPIKYLEGNSNLGDFAG